MKMSTTTGHTALYTHTYIHTYMHNYRNVDHSTVFYVKKKCDIQTVNTIIY